MQCYALDDTYVSGWSDVPVFRNDYGIIHQDEVLAGVGADAVYRLRGWDLASVGDLVVACRSFERTVRPTGIPYHEITTFQLVHTPGR